MAPNKKRARKQDVPAWDMEKFLKAQAKRERRRKREEEARKAKEQK